LKGKVVVGMSGGVDSSVAAYLLQEEGYEVIGVTLKHLGEEDSEDTNTKTCCSLDDIHDAKMACFKIGIPHYVVNTVDLFKKKVIDYFVEEYSNGITPSPCIICDEKIKIKKLVESADRMGAEYISTGHYCDVSYSEKLDAHLLKLSKNISKDQTYMLYRLGESVLKRMLFPLKNMEKDQVRRIAEKVGISVHDKKDSQGICFAPGGYKEFLKKNLGEKIKSGKFVTKDGLKLGNHEGYQLYTIGQRRGLGITLPKVYFITDIIPEKNEIVLGDFEDLMKKEVELAEYKFLVDIKKLGNMELLGRPRFSSTRIPGKLRKSGDKIFFVYDDKNAKNSPGQHMVIYYGDIVVGGGKIVF
jgi:tRNA-specific 2-thiouridylase